MMVQWAGSSPKFNNIHSIHCKCICICKMYIQCLKYYKLFVHVRPDHWGDPDADGRIIVRWIFGNWEGFVGTGWSWLRIGTGGGHL